MPAARRDQIGVALNQPNALVRQTQAIGQDLGEGRLVALPDGLGAGDQRNGAVRFEPDVDILVRRAAGRLDVIGKAEASSSPRASLSSRRSGKPSTSAAANARSK